MSMETSSNNLDNVKVQMRKGLLEYCILLTIAREKKAYASDILTELKKDDLLVVEGTLYPLLSRLKSDLLLDYEWEESSAGPPRKYYHLTPKGKLNLQALNETWEGLATSINSLVKKYEKNH